MAFSRSLALWVLAFFTCGLGAPPRDARAAGRPADMQRAESAMAPAVGAGPACLADGRFPDRLSQTGCFAHVPTRTVAKGLVLYEVASPLWTDGTHKRRWMALPAGRRIRVAANGQWTFPVGSVLVKEFAFDPIDGQPASRRPIETRLMRLGPNGWDFRSYRWNEQGTDATRLDATEHVILTVQKAAPPALPTTPVPKALSVPGPALKQGERLHLIPSPRECTYCHSEAAGLVLGPHSAQMDRLIEVAGKRVNQLDHLASLGLFDPASRVHLPAARVLPDPSDAKLSLEKRARSYLHGQCAHCHLPGGWAPPALTLDLRYDTPLAGTATCGVYTQYFKEEPRILAGDPDGSAIWGRMKVTNVHRMPPIGTGLVDPASLVVRDWIASLERCPPPRL